ncbi:MAG: response regulator [Candidatus Ancaeobacter aquaticus]|nr:response regulator [Candidatus Ancaeobacter aquaticus]
MAGEKILVIDDTPIIGTAFQKELGPEGYAIDVVYDAESALAKIKKNKYDIIFVDLVLPGMDGVQTCKEITAISPDSIQIFMTGNFETDPIFKEAEFIQAGGKTYYLYKPFAKGELLEVTRKALNEKNKK